MGAGIDWPFSLHRSFFHKQCSPKMCRSDDLTKTERSPPFWPMRASLPLGLSVNSPLPSPAFPISPPFPLPNPSFPRLMREQTQFRPRCRSPCADSGENEVVFSGRCNIVAFHTRALGAVRHIALSTRRVRRYRPKEKNVNYTKFFFARTQTRIEYGPRSTYILSLIVTWQEGKGYGPGGPIGVSEVDT